MLEQIYSRDLVNVKVSGVLGISGVSIVTRRNHRIEDRLEQLKRLFVSGDEAASLDHRVALIVDASFDAMTDVNSQLGSFVLELFVNAGISTHCFGKDVAKTVKCRSISVIYLCSERSGSFSGRFAARKVAPFSSQLYSLSPHPS